MDQLSADLNQALADKVDSLQNQPSVDVNQGLAEKVESLQEEMTGMRSDHSYCK